MPEVSPETVDPRIRRTRQMFQHALGKLLENKEFDKISVQDIAEAATLNRATFYDHYPDKFALLEAMVAIQFQELLARRQVSFDGTCSSALISMVLAVCDFLAGTPGMSCPAQGQMKPHLESAVIAVLRRVLLDGLQARHTSAHRASPEMIAATLSWAIYGAAKEWVQTPNRCPSEEIAGTVVTLVSPLLALLHADQPAH
jgi:AcrR family transcriptional regulator